MLIRSLCWVVAAMVLMPACATDPVKKDVASDGLPIWISQPCVGLPPEAVCATAESDLAAADVEAAKSDAETTCKNRIADQLQAEVGRLTERLSSAMKELGDGKIYGERTMKDINQSFQQMSLRGLRYTDYFYAPSRVQPKKVFVRAILTLDSNKFSQDLLAAMIAEAAAAKLEIKHEEAMSRFEVIRRQFLEEKASQQSTK
jgi:hypothetical protein